MMQNQPKCENLTLKSHFRIFKTLNQRIFRHRTINLRDAISSRDFSISISVKHLPRKIQGVHRNSNQQGKPRKNLTLSNCHSKAPENTVHTDIRVSVP